MHLPSLQSVNSGPRPQASAGGGNPFDLNGFEDIRDLTGFQPAEKEKNRPDRNEASPLSDEMDKQMQIKQLAELIERQQQEVEKLQQTISQQLKALNPQEDPNAVAFLKPLEEAMGKKTDQITELSNMLNAMIANANAGGFVGKPLASGSGVLGGGSRGFSIVA